MCVIHVFFLLSFLFHASLVFLYCYEFVSQGNTSRMMALSFHGHTKYIFDLRIWALQILTSFFLDTVVVNNACYLRRGKPYSYLLKALQLNNCVVKTLPRFLL